MIIVRKCIIRGTPYLVSALRVYSEPSDVDFTRLSVEG